MANKQYQVLALNAIAAIAAKAAADLNGDRLWPGELEKALSEIRRHLQDANPHRGSDL